MKILLYCINYFPESVGCGKYNKKIRDILVKSGCDVKVITSVPYYPKWKLMKPFKWNFYSFKKNIIRCPIFIPKKMSLKRRIVYMLSFLIASFPIVIAYILKPPKVILIIQPSVVTIIPALIIKFFRNTKIWMHIQDLEIEAATSNQYVTRNRLIIIIEKFIFKIYKKFDAITVVSKSMMEYLEKQDLNVTYLPNWPDNYQLYSKDEALEKINISINKELFYNKNNKFILYSGNIGQKQNIEDFIYLFNEIKLDNFYLIICGDGANKKNIVSLSACNKKIININLLSKYNYNLLMLICDYYLLPVNNSNNQFMLPSKLIEMIKYEKPIISNADYNSEIGQTILSNSGLLIDFKENNSKLINYINNINIASKSQNLCDQSRSSYDNTMLVINSTLRGLSV